ncbi:TPA: hypothetical protein ACFU2R_001459 [Neisseria subflava]
MRRCNSVDGFLGKFRQAALNQRVFYDVLSNRILGQAPDTTVLELGV